MITVREARICHLFLLILVAGIFSRAPELRAQQDAPRKVKKEVKPQYPPLASQLKLSGTVKVNIVIAPDGKVTSAHATGGHPVFVPAAVDAASHYEFEPAAKETTQTIEFKFARDNNQD